MEGTVVEGARVFVGNLPFKTRHEDLTTMFEEFGEVKSARMALRARRSLGYGFVTMATAEAANAAVAKLQNSEYEGRQLNVELAKPESADRPPRETNGEAGEGKPRRPRRRSGPRKQNGAEDGASSDDDAAKRATQPRRRNFGGEGDAEEGEEGQRRPRRPRTRRPRKTSEGGERKPETEEEREARRQRARERQQERATKREEQPDHETEVFVSNIPYSFGEDDILKAFEGLKITKVRVMRTSMGKSRGFCFIDLADHGEQQKALQEIPTKEINGRNPSCRVSKVDPKKSEGDAENPEQ